MIVLYLLNWRINFAFLIKNFATANFGSSKHALLHLIAITLFHLHLIAIILFQDQIQELHKAASKGNLRDFQSILDRKALILGRDQIGATPLHKSVLYGHYELAQYIASNFSCSLHAKDNVRMIRQQQNWETNETDTLKQHNWSFLITEKQTEKETEKETEKNNKK